MDGVHFASVAFASCATSFAHTHTRIISMELDTHKNEEIINKIQIGYYFVYLLSWSNTKRNERRRPLNEWLVFMCRR